MLENRQEVESKDKYKMFRNFMTNELGISRSDIETWTKEAVASEVKKIVGQMNLDALTQSAIRSAIGQHGGVNSDISNRIARIVSEQIIVSLRS